MPLNGIKAVGDDQQWKQELEKIVASLTSQVNVLNAQVATLNKRVNGL